MIIHFDDDGDVTDIEFIDFSELADEEAFDELLDSLDSEGLLEEFEHALWELHSWCVEQDILGVGVGTTFGGAGISGAGALTGTTFLSWIGLGAAHVGIGVAGISGHWSLVGKAIAKLLHHITDQKDDRPGGR